MLKMADCGEGFTRIANQLLDALVAANLTKHQFKVALAVIRKTDGFNQPYDWISNGQLAALTGLPETRVSTAKNQLLTMGVLVRKGHQIGINKVLSEWECKLPRFVEEFPETGKGRFPELGKGTSPKQGKVVSLSWGKVLPRNRETQKTLIKRQKQKTLAWCPQQRTPRR
ncbi:replication protein [Aeromonas eucrenophila]|uniref:Replication protein n=1 Tax=Aeromonas eucrenophila TaxID=649 RepID=A0ABW0Y671_9GAMM|nr:replication protein [Aeromonas eucrenophila]